MTDSFSAGDHRNPDAQQPAGAADVRDDMLTQVAFKWLMSGQGCWVDSGRMRCDPAYAAGLLRLALASSSPALRACATALLSHAGGTAAS
jgi:hypothetical protein